MEIVPFIITYNGMATGSCVTQCAEYLMNDAPDFGAAIKRVDIYAHCQTSDAVVASLASMDERFQQRINKLPMIRFRRKSQLVEISYASAFLYTDALFGKEKIPLSAANFGCLCREFAAALSLIQRRIKLSDDFDMDALNMQLQRRLASLEFSFSPNGQAN